MNFLTYSHRPDYRAYQWDRWEGLIMADVLAIAGFAAIFAIFGLILRGLGRI